MALDLDAIRRQFPALSGDATFLDNPGGTQVPQAVLARMSAYLQETNANRGGAFATSRASDQVLTDARRATADFLNAGRPEEVVFGPNMTSLTLHLSRSLAHMLNPDDTLIVTRLDHDANISPWMHVAEMRGCRLRWVDFDVETGMLQMDDYERALQEAPRLVAVGYASNALGTVNPLRRMIQMAHEAGALVYVDAVQYAPHGPIDVQDLDCDFLVCSAYKIFGPHLGMLYGRYDLLDSLQAYKVRPASDRPPGKFEPGTQNHEGIAGWLAALQYLEWLGEVYGQTYAEKYQDRFGDRRLRLKQAMAAIRAYEQSLSRRFLEVLMKVSGLRIYGPVDPRQIDARVPTFAFNLNGRSPREVATRLDDYSIYVWDGNYYALAVTVRLGVEEQGGMVRAGAAHYNTLEEVERFGEALQNIASVR